VASAARWVIAALALTACSGSGSSTATSAASTVAASTTALASPAAPPRVDLIHEAVTALEKRLGGPQQYFEINATPQLVNLFVALNDGKVAQPWVYLDGELSSTDARDASGFSFAASALDFDPATVLSRIEAELPKSSPNVFFVEAGAGGVVRYSVGVTSQQGGQLVVVVGPDGTVKSVDA
jgi:hypothetical protein